MSNSGGTERTSSKPSRRKSRRDRSLPAYTFAYTDRSPEGPEPLDTQPDGLRRKSPAPALRVDRVADPRFRHVGRGRITAHPHIPCVTLPHHSIVPNDREEHVEPATGAETIRGTASDGIVERARLIGHEPSDLRVAQVGKHLLRVPGTGRAQNDPLPS